MVKVQKIDQGKTFYESSKYQKYINPQDAVSCNRYCNSVSQVLVRGAMDHPVIIIWVGEVRYKNTVALVAGHYQGLPGDGTGERRGADQLVAVTSKTMVPIKKCICQICTFIVRKHYFSFGKIGESQHSFTSLH